MDLDDKFDEDVLRVMRGDAWASVAARCCPAFRSASLPGDRDQPRLFGFRLVRCPFRIS